MLLRSILSSEWVSLALLANLIFQNASLAVLSIGMCPLSREFCDSTVDGTVRRIKRISTLAIPTRHKARIRVRSIRTGGGYVARRELRRSLKTRGSRRLFFPICTRMFLPLRYEEFLSGQWCNRSSGTSEALHPLLYATSIPIIPLLNFFRVSTVVLITMDNMRML